MLLELREVAFDQDGDIMDFRQKFNLDAAAGHLNTHFRAVKDIGFETDQNLPPPPLQPRSDENGVRHVARRLGDNLRGSRRLDDTVNNFDGAGRISGGCRLDNRCLKGQGLGAVSINGDGSFGMVLWKISVLDKGRLGNGSRSNRLFACDKLGHWRFSRDRLLDRDGPPPTDVNRDGSLPTGINCNGLLTTDVNRDGSLPTGINCNGLLTTGINCNGPLAAGANRNGLLTTGINCTGRNGLLAANINRNGLLAAGANRNGQLAANINRNGLLPASINRDGLLAANIDRDGSLTDRINRDGPLPAGVNHDGQLTAGVNRDGLLSASIDRDGPLTASIDRDGLLTASIDRDGLLPTGINHDGPLTAALANLRLLSSTRLDNRRLKHQRPQPMATDGFRQFARHDGLRHRLKKLRDRPRIWRGNLRSRLARHLGLRRQIQFNQWNRHLRQPSFFP